VKNKDGSGIPPVGSLNDAVCVVKTRNNGTTVRQMPYSLASESLDGKLLGDVPDGERSREIKSQEMCGVGRELDGANECNWSLGLRWGLFSVAFVFSFASSRSGCGRRGRSGRRAPKSKAAFLDNLTLAAFFGFLGEYTKIYGSNVLEKGWDVKDPPEADGGSHGMDDLTWLRLWS
jgi:hypothetical protein